MTDDKGTPEDRATRTAPHDRPDNQCEWSPLKNLQAVLLVIGIASGATYAAGQIEGRIASRSSIETFDHAEPTVSDARNPPQ